MWLERITFNSIATKAQLLDQFACGFSQNDPQARGKIPDTKSGDLN